MSIVSSLLPLLLLCLTMHASKALHLGIIDKESGRQAHLSGEELEKVKLVNSLSPFEVKPSPSEELLTGNGEETIDESQGGGSTERPKESEALPKEVIKTTGKVTSVAQVESLVSDSLRIPHDKHREHPGYNLDYSPPKTHPPSHN